MIKNKNLLKQTPLQYVLFFTLPAVFLLFCFLLLPVVFSFGFSFMNFNMLKPQAAFFTGFENHVRLLTDPTFYKALKNTVYFTVIVVLYQDSLAFLLALLVKRNIRGIGIFRTAYFTPLVTSITVVSILWTFIYNPNPTQGLLNALRIKIGLAPSQFLHNPKTAMNSIIFMSGWHSAGYHMMILLAGLQAIPNELYEAAEIDGAGPIHQFLHVTIPGIKNVLIFVVQVTMISAMKLFTQPYVMTQGGPKESTKTLTYYIYQQGFQFRNIGYASTISILFFIIVVTLSLTMKHIIKEK
ncbi:sugar ABC transporter permease [Treponema sp. HNW]|uniref:carbohydrate ABC transporter permease n=1 Tax=Treponema sp. HNW TaxID=3116654 RepID=UPI003D10930B